MVLYTELFYAIIPACFHTFAVLLSLHHHTFFMFFTLVLLCNGKFSFSPLIMYGSSLVPRKSGLVSTICACVNYMYTPYIIHHHLPTVLIQTYTKETPSSYDYS